MTGLPPAPIHVGHIERAVQFTLRKWLWTYLAFAEQWYDLQPRSLMPIHGPFITASVSLAAPTTRIPLVVLHGGATAETNLRGDVYDAAWPLEVVVVAGGSALSEEYTLTIARAYGDAVKTCLTWQPLEGLPDSVEPYVRWMDEVSDLPAEINRRTMAAVHLAFRVDVSNVLVRADIPRTPEPLPDPPDGGWPEYPDAPTVEQTNITVEPRES